MMQTELEMLYKNPALVYDPKVSRTVKGIFKQFPDKELDDVKNDASHLFASLMDFIHKEYKKDWRSIPRTVMKVFSMNTFFYTRLQEYCFSQNSNSKDLMHLQDWFEVLYQST